MEATHVPLGTAFICQAPPQMPAGDALSFLFHFPPPYDQREPAAAVQQAKQ
jgi:hypothetical protein